MEDQYVIVKGYKDNEILRKSFNELSEKTFGLSFEDWYEKGYWKEKYNPYSIACNNEVIANVSVNQMDFLENGIIKKYIQLGTVMTKEDDRKRGLIRSIMEEIDQDYKNRVDGFYLFANDSVLNFYPKFGFFKEKEYKYTKNVHIEKEICAMQVPMNRKEELKLLEEAIDNSVSNSSFEMKNNKELILFYVTKFMEHDVFYIEKENSYVVAEIEEEKLFIHCVIGPKVVNLDSVIETFGKNIKKVTLGFTPFDQNGYDILEVQEEDSTLFLRGRDFEGFGKERKMFPTLSHA